MYLPIAHLHCPDFRTTSEAIDKTFGAEVHLMWSKFATILRLSLQHVSLAERNRSERIPRVVSVSSATVVVAPWRCPCYVRMEATSRRVASLSSASDQVLDCLGIASGGFEFHTYLSDLGWIQSYIHIFATRAPLKPSIQTHRKPAPNCSQSPLVPPLGSTLQRQSWSSRNPLRLMRA